MTNKRVILRELMHMHMHMQSCYVLSLKLTRQVHVPDII